MADFELLAPGGHQELVDEVLDRLDTKADYDGYYQQLTAGAADSLTGRGDGVSASYLYRTTGGDADVADGTATVKSIHGRTVVWNQLNSDTDNTNTTGLTVTKNGDGSRTLNGTATSNGVIYFVGDIKPVANHKYLVRGCPAGGSASTYYLSMNGQNADYGTGGIITVTNPLNPSRFLMWVANGQTFSNVTIWPQAFDLTVMFGAGNEPSTVAEFEALYPEPYYEYDAGSLLSVQMEGIETVGFNQLDPANVHTNIFVNGSTGKIIAATNAQTAIIEVFPNTDYCLTYTGGDRCIIAGVDSLTPAVGDDARVIFPSGSRVSPKVFNSGENRYIAASIATSAASASNICINLSWSGYRNGEYEPYWKSERTIPATDLRSAGTVYDEQTATERITRVGAVDLGTLTWTPEAAWQQATGLTRLWATVSDAVTGGSGNVIASGYFEPNLTVVISTMSTAYCIAMYSGRVYVTMPYPDIANAADFVTWLQSHPTTIHYELATPTTQPIDPPLNLTYRVSDFGTERIMVPANEQSAPPTMQVVYGLNVVDTVRRLPTEYISHDSFTQFRITLGAFLDATVTESWDATDGRYEYTITQNGE